MAVAVNISIHAPSRERPTQRPTRSMYPTFQSTLPRGSDCLDTGNSVIFRDFNPRSLAGATRSHACMVLYISVFQSTLPRGSDLVQPPSFFVIGISIHAPSRERPLSRSSTALVIEFQSTLPRGSDRSHACMVLYISVFQSTLPRGSDGANRTQERRA